MACVNGAVVHVRSGNINPWREKNDSIDTTNWLSERENGRYGLDPSYVTNRRNGLMFAMSGENLFPNCYANQLDGLLLDGQVGAIAF
jgi:hypothetical protein